MIPSLLPRLSTQSITQFSRVHLDTFHLAPAAVPMTLSSRIDPVRVQRPEATYSSWPRWLAASVCLCGVVRSSSLPAALAVRNANESQAASPSIGIGSCLAAVAHTQLPSFPTSHQPASLPASRTRRFPRLRCVLRFDCMGIESCTATVFGGQPGAAA